MSSFTPGIPQPTDDPSNSQDLLLQNFQTLNNLYGTTGDHYPWTDQTSVGGGKHAKVTLPGLPTVNNVPGNVLPVPAPGNGVMFGVTAGPETRPFWRRDTGTDNYPLGPVIAMARVDPAGTPIGVPFRLTAVAGASFIDFTFAPAEPDGNYLVLATGGAGSSGITVSANTQTANGFRISFVRVTTSETPREVSVIVLRYSL